MLQFFECCLASLSHTWRRLYLSARGFDQIHFDFENNKISHLKLIPGCRYLSSGCWKDVISDDDKCFGNYHRSSLDTNRFCFLQGDYIFNWIGLLIWHHNLHYSVLPT